MLAIPPEELSQAFALLEPGDRALLELSLHREVADPALAELLRVEPQALVRQRADSLELLAGALGAPVADVEEALVRHWRGEPSGADVQEAVVVEAAIVASEEPGAAAEEPAAERERPRRRALWLGALAAGAALVVLLVALTGGDDGDSADGGGQPSPAAQEPGGSAPAEPGSGRVSLQRVPGSADVAGTARIVESDGRPRLELRLAGLSDRRYAVWLYNSVSETRQIGRFRGPEGHGRVPLPEGYERFRYIDVSREPADGNPNHSGESVLRLPVEALTQG